MTISSSPRGYVKMGRMTQRQPHRRLGLAAASAVSAAALLIAPTVTPATGIMASASADPCPDVELIFARGTSEPAGIGRVGQALADNLQGQLGGRSLGTYGVNYPATYDFLAAADGAADATAPAGFFVEAMPKPAATASASTPT